MQYVANVGPYYNSANPVRSHIEGIMNVGRNKIKSNIVIHIVIPIYNSTYKYTINVDNKPTRQVRWMKIHLVFQPTSELS